MHGGTLHHRIAVVWLILLFLSLISPAAQEAQKTTTAPVAPKSLEQQEEQRKVVGEPIDPQTYVVGPEDILKVLV